MNEEDKAPPPTREYPPIYETMVPIALVVIVVVVVVLLLIILGVALGLIGG